MAKHKKRSKKAKNKIDWPSVLISALIDLVVGTLLIIIEKMIK